MTEPTPTEATPIATREWTHSDRAKWPSGPWDGEPDKRQWTDETTGLPCLIVRNGVGALCGYVGVHEGHPAFGVDYEDIDGTWNDDYSDRTAPIVPGVEVHGGLTFSGLCQTRDPEHGVCHVVEPGQPDKVWWLGFDCAHCGDLTPVLSAHGGDTYKDVAYVTAECERLALNLAATRG